MCKYRVDQCLISSEFMQYFKQLSYSSQFLEMYL